MTQNNEQGGANALRGFNFQTAMGALIAVFNYTEEDFKMVVEGAEDIVVHKKGICTFIQVKSSSLKTSDLLRTPKPKKNGERRLAVLYKLLSHDSKQEKERYKLIVSDKFSEKDLQKKFQLSDQAQILDTVYSPTEQTISVILKQMQKDGINLSQEKVREFFLYRAPFHTDLESASRYICGVMNEREILTDHGAGRRAFEEVIRIIYQKSECIEMGGVTQKEISSAELKRIFRTSRRPLLAREILEQLFPDFVFKRDQIEKNIYDVPFRLQYHKKQIHRKLGKISIDDSISPAKYIQHFNEQLEDYPLSENEKYAILIDLLLDMYEGFYDY